MGSSSLPFLPPALPKEKKNPEGTGGMEDGREKGKSNQLDATATANITVRVRGGEGRDRNN